MSWILCTDCTDGQRMAFPAISTAISFDMRGYRKNIREQMKQAENMQPNPMALASAMAQKESVESIHARSEEEKAAVLARYKRVLSAEAILIFSGREGVIAVRGVHFATDFKAVELYTSEGNKIVHDGETEDDV